LEGGGKYISLGGTRTAVATRGSSLRKKKSSNGRYRASNGAEFRKGGEPVSVVSTVPAGSVNTP